MQNEQKVQEAYGRLIRNGFKQDQGGNLRAPEGAGIGLKLWGAIDCLRNHTTIKVLAI